MEQANKGAANAACAIICLWEISEGILQDVSEGLQSVARDVAGEFSAARAGGENTFHALAHLKEWQEQSLPHLLLHRDVMTTVHRELAAVLRHFSTERSFRAVRDSASCALSAGEKMMAAFLRGLDTWNENAHFFGRYIQSAKERAAELMTDAAARCGRVVTNWYSRNRAIAGVIRTRTVDTREEGIFLNARISEPMSWPASAAGILNHAYYQQGDFPSTLVLVPETLQCNVCVFPRSAGNRATGLCILSTAGERVVLTIIEVDTRILAAGISEDFEDALSSTCAFALTTPPRDSCPIRVNALKAITLPSKEDLSVDGSEGRRASDLCTQLGNVCPWGCSPEIIDCTDQSVIGQVSSALPMALSFCAGSTEQLVHMAETHLREKLPNGVPRAAAEDVLTVPRLAHLVVRASEVIACSAAEERAVGRLQQAHSLLLPLALNAETGEKEVVAKTTMPLTAFVDYMLLLLHGICRGTLAQEREEVSVHMNRLFDAFSFHWGDEAEEAVASDGAGLVMDMIDEVCAPGGGRRREGGILERLVQRSEGMVSSLSGVAEALRPGALGEGGDPGAPPPSVYTWFVELVRVGLWVVLGTKHKNVFEAGRTRRLGPDERQEGDTAFMQTFWDDVVSAGRGVTSARTSSGIAEIEQIAFDATHDEREREVQHFREDAAHGPMFPVFVAIAASRWNVSPLVFEREPDAIWPGARMPSIVPYLRVRDYVARHAVAALALEARPEEDRALSVDFAPSAVMFAYIRDTVTPGWIVDAGDGIRGDLSSASRRTAPATGSTRFMLDGEQGARIVHLVANAIGDALSTGLTRENSHHIFRLLSDPASACSPCALLCSLAQIVRASAGAELAQLARYNAMPTPALELWSTTCAGNVNFVFSSSLCALPWSEMDEETRAKVAEYARFVRKRAGEHGLTMDAIERMDAKSLRVLREYLTTLDIARTELGTRIRNLDISKFGGAVPAEEEEEEKEEPSIADEMFTFSSEAVDLGEQEEEEEEEKEREKETAERESRRTVGVRGEEGSVTILPPTESGQYEFIGRALHSIRVELAKRARREESKSASKMERLTAGAWSLTKRAFRTTVGTPSKLALRFASMFARKERDPSEYTDETVLRLRAQPEEKRLYLLAKEMVIFKIFLPVVTTMEGLCAQTERIKRAGAQASSSALLAPEGMLAMDREMRATDADRENLPAGGLSESMSTMVSFLRGETDSLTGDEKTRVLEMVLSLDLLNSLGRQSRECGLVMDPQETQYVHDVPRAGIEKGFVPVLARSTAPACADGVLQNMGFLAGALVPVNELFLTEPFLRELDRLGTLEAFMARGHLIPTIYNTQACAHRAARGVLDDFIGHVVTTRGRSEGVAELMGVMFPAAVSHALVAGDTHDALSGLGTLLDMPAMNIDWDALAVNFPFSERTFSVTPVDVIARDTAGEKEFMDMERDRAMHESLEGLLQRMSYHVVHSVVRAGCKLMTAMLYLDTEECMLRALRMDASCGWDSVTTPELRHHPLARDMFTLLHAMENGGELFVSSRSAAEHQAILVFLGLCWLDGCDDARASEGRVVPRVLLTTVLPGPGGTGTGSIFSCAVSPEPAAGSGSDPAGARADMHFVWRPLPDGTVFLSATRRSVVTMVHGASGSDVPVIYTEDARRVLLNTGTLDEVPRQMTARTDRGASTGPTLRVPRGASGTVPLPGNDIAVTLDHPCAGIRDMLGGKWEGVLRGVLQAANPSMTIDVVFPSSDVSVSLSASPRPVRDRDGKDISASFDSDCKAMLGHIVRGARGDATFVCLESGISDAESGAIPPMIGALLSDTGKIHEFMQDMQLLGLSRQAFPRLRVFRLPINTEEEGSLFRLVPLGQARNILSMMDQSSWSSLPRLARAVSAGSIDVHGKKRIRRSSDGPWMCLQWNALSAIVPGETFLDVHEHEHWNPAAVEIAPGHSRTEARAVNTAVIFLSAHCGRVMHMHLRERARALARYISPNDLMRSMAEKGLVAAAGEPFEDKRDTLLPHTGMVDPSLWHSVARAHWADDSCTHLLSQ